MAGMRMKSFLSRGGSNSNVDKREAQEQSLWYRIFRRNWPILREIFSRENAREQLLSGLSRQSFPDDPPIENLLLYTCQGHPPFDVVKMMIDVYPEGVGYTDKMGRYPLHVASKSGASPDVIKYLAEMYPPSALAQDVMGKTALHLACENYVHYYDPKAEGGVPLKESMLLVIKALCRAAPTSVNLEDMDGMTALEYAIECNMDLKSIKELQRACEKDWRRRRIESGGAKHSAIESGLQEPFQDRRARLRQDIMEMTGIAMAFSTTLSDGTDTESLDQQQQPPATAPSPPQELELEPRERKKTSARALLA